MVLFHAGAMLGKGLVDKFSSNGAQQIARTSSVMSSSSLNNNWKPRPRTRAANPFEKQEVLSRMGGSGARRLTTKARDASENPMDITDWVAVYRYPGIRGCQLLARAKFVQTLASLTYLPYSTYQFSTGAVSPTFFYSTAALAIAAPIVLAIFSRYINRLVGVIAMSEDNEWIRVGYLTFWGRRKNKYLQLDDILPLSEAGLGDKDRVIKLSWYSGGGDCLFLLTDHCEILDEERAEVLFGSTKIFDKKPKSE